MGESVDGFTFSSLRVDVPPGANISVAVTYDHLLGRKISKYYHGVYFIPDQVNPINRGYLRAHNTGLTGGVCVLTILD
uniref:Uncharacterized protein n=1 Tax=Timema douglasi TaxID=61478 RepID=A0A7R8ZFC3_TIMDO|nr:unnamed protein product [Timema douglasi]